MRRWAALGALAVAALAAGGCSPNRWTFGAKRPEEGYHVSVTAPTLEQARRQAVSQFFELFMTTATQAASTDVLEREVLSKADSFLSDEDSHKRKGGVELGASVAWARLGRTLDSLGLVRVQAFQGRPTLQLSLSADGGQAPAVAALQRRLLQLGYRLVDSGGDVVITGGSVTAPMDRPLAGLKGVTVTLTLSARTADGKPVDSIEQQAGAVDAKAEDAHAKAMESAATLAANALQTVLSPRFNETAPYTVTVLDLGDLSRAKRWIETLRQMPAVAAVALDAVSENDFRVRLYARGLGLDELAGKLLRLNGFKLRVRQVEPDFSEIELASGDDY